MIPTRKDINEKILECWSSPSFQVKQQVYVAISDWLTEIECPAADKEKILTDLESYDSF